MTGSAVLNNTLGAAFVGQFVSTILLGVTIIQVWNYYWNYRRDPQTLKVFIAVLVGLDVLHTVLCFYMFYWYLILNFGDVDGVQFNMWAMDLQGICAGFISFLVQLTYARRVYILSNKIIFPAVIAGAAITFFTCGLVYTAEEAAIKRFSRYGNMTLLACVAMGSMLTGDILIALLMCWFLYHKRTGLARTDYVVMTLMSYSISSGLLTSVVAVATVTAYVIKPTSLLHEAFFWILVKIHVNSLLAMLNTRDSILERSANNLHPGPQSTFHVGSFITQQQKESTHESTSQPAAISVNMHQTATADFAP